MMTRRGVIEVGGGLLTAFLVRPSWALAADIVEIAMQGSPDGGHVWFDPVGVHIQPGQTVRWTNHDLGNSHTATAYDGSLFERPRRIPAGAKAWNSDYLLPEETFSVTLTAEGVYDYYCIPHELAGMVGRIVVGTPPPGEPGPDAGDASLTPLPEAALANFPSVQTIMANGIVQRS